MKFNKSFYPFAIFILIFLTSCNNNESYLQEYKNYKELHTIKNQRLTCWFPVKLIKSDAKKIKNISYLSTKCVFGVFNYSNGELYNLIFTDEAIIDSIHFEIFLSQIEKVKKNIPEWFLEVDYWTAKQREIILFDNCYIYRDTENKQIYYFHPEEESTFINGKIYPGIRNTIR